MDRRELEVVILAGGEGSRLKRDMPDLKMKCLLPITPTKNIFDCVYQELVYKNSVYPYTRFTVVVKTGQQFLTFRDRYPANRLTHRLIDCKREEDMLYGHVSYSGTFHAFMEGAYGSYWSVPILYVCGDHVFEEDMLIDFLTKAIRINQPCRTLRDNCPETPPIIVVGVTQVTNPNEALYYCDDQMIVRYMTQACHPLKSSPPAGLKPYADVGLAYFKNYMAFHTHIKIPLYQTLYETTPKDISRISIGLADVLELACPVAVDLTPYKYVNVNTIEDYRRAIDLRKD